MECSKQNLKAVVFMSILPLNIPMCNSINSLVWKKKYSSVLLIRFLFVVFITSAVRVAVTVVVVFQWYVCNGVFAITTTTTRTMSVMGLQYLWLSLPMRFKLIKCRNEHQCTLRYTQVVVAVAINRWKWKIRTRNGEREREK